MKNAKVLILLAFAIVATVAILYFVHNGGVGVSKILTRDKAAKMILAYSREQPGLDNIVGQLGWAADVFTCSQSTTYEYRPNISLSVLKKEGLVSGEGKLTAFTEKAKPYMYMTSYNGADAAIIARLKNVQVTGLAKNGTDEMWADVTIIYEPTPFGEACSCLTTYKRGFDFKLYDDGWRITGISIPTSP